MDLDIHITFCQLFKHSVLMFQAYHSDDNNDLSENCRIQFNLMSICRIEFDLANF